MKRKVWIGILLLCPFLFHCSEKSSIEAYQFEPLDSLTFNSTLVALGEKLFFDPKLSINNTVSCASCHQPNRAFTDGKKRSIGIHRRIGKRNAPTLWNVKNQDKFMWEGGVKNLELQAIVPLQDTNEMGSLVADLFPKLSDIPYYDSLANLLYNRSFDPYVLTRALGAYQRSLYTENSPFDDWKSKKQVKDSALIRGYEIFSEKLNCAQCHSGKQFTNNALENNGLYSVYADQGRYMISADSSDIGKFKVPTLRNIEITAPYMHDGSLQSLEAVIDHYEKGGARHPNQSELITPFSLTEKERKDLLYFLKSLTDHRFEN